MQKRAGRGRPPIETCTQTLAVSRPGALRSSEPAASVTASGAMKDSGEAPSGSPIRLSSAARMPVTVLRSVSRSLAKTRIGTVGGSAPVRPATASRSSLEILPSVWPSDAYL